MWAGGRCSTTKNASRNQRYIPIGRDDPRNRESAGFRAFTGLTASVNLAAYSATLASLLATHRNTRGVP